MKMINASELIDKRKRSWTKHKDIEKDRVLRDGIAAYMVGKDGKELRKEVKNNPEYLIELFYVIVDKEMNTVPFFLNEVQAELMQIINNDIELFNQGKKLHLKYLLLKGRQQGMTSFINAYQLARAIMHKNFSGYTLADSTDNTENIFSDKARYYFDNLPDKIKPSVKYSNRKEFDFSKEGGGGMNSKWRVSTAGNIDAGRSKTLNFFHGSEASFWSDLKRILTGLAEAFTKSCIVILETTSNGFNEYRSMWVGDNNYTKLFFEWWKTSEYTVEFEDPKIAQEFINKVTEAREGTDDADMEHWALYRCKWLKETKQLTWGQVYWYFNKWKDKKLTIKQEYPCSPEESFLATGKNYFNMEIVSNRLDELKEQYKLHKPIRGYFTYEYGTSKWSSEKIILDKSIQFVEDYELGYITLYNRDIPKTEPYTLGADTAGDGSDKNVGHVLDTKQNQVAVIAIKKDEDLFADQLYCLGKMYNDALIAVETNFSTYVNNTLKNREYPHLYIRENSPDAISKQIIQKYGFNTNKATRPAMLAELKTLVRERIECINDIDTLQEMFTFIIDDRSKPVAIVGEHDDYILSLAISIYTQEQQINEIKLAADKLVGYFTDTELEDMGYSVWEIRQYHEGQPLNRR